MQPCHAFATKCGCCPTGRRSPFALRRSLPNRNRATCEPQTGSRDPLADTACSICSKKPLCARTFLTCRAVASRERLPREVLHRRLSLCLYGLGTNTGFKRLPGADPGRRTRICATRGAATSTKSNCAMPSPKSPVPFSPSDGQKSGAKEPPPVHPTPRSSEPGTKICSRSGIFVIVDLEL